MTAQDVLRRAQVFGFLAQGFLYPEENWTGEFAELATVSGLNGGAAWIRVEGLSLEALQSEHRRAFGLTGSLAYETECGLPNEFRQSQELADIAGFYRAFGLKMGGRVRERPDHIAAELEFMSVLALKEAIAIEAGEPDGLEVCVQAERKFLQDHLGQWIGLLAQGLGRIIADNPYTALARFAAEFVAAEAARLEVPLDTPDVKRIQPTPSPATWDCEACPLGPALQE